MASTLEPPPHKIEELRGWKNWFYNLYIRSEDHETRIAAVEGGISGTLTFGGGSTGEIATLTVVNGVITGKTLVP